MQEDSGTVVNGIEYDSFMLLRDPEMGDAVGFLKQWFPWPLSRELYDAAGQKIESPRQCLFTAVPSYKLPVPIMRASVNLWIARNIALGADPGQPPSALPLCEGRWIDLNGFTIDGGVPEPPTVFPTWGVPTPLALWMVLTEWIIGDAENESAQSTLNAVELSPQWYCAETTFAEGIEAGRRQGIPDEEIEDRLPDLVFDAEGLWPDGVLQGLGLPYNPITVSYALRRALEGKHIRCRIHTVPGPASGVKVTSFCLAPLTSAHAPQIKSEVISTVVTTNQRLTHEFGTAIADVVTKHNEWWQGFPIGRFSPYSRKTGRTADRGSPLGKARTINRGGRPVTVIQRKHWAMERLARDLQALGDKRVPNGTVAEFQRLLDGEEAQYWRTKLSAKVKEIADGFDDAKPPVWYEIRGGKERNAPRKGG